MPIRLSFLAIVSSVLGLAAVAAGQPQTQGSVTWTLSAQEYGQGPGPGWTHPIAGGNGNGFIEPGEGVLFSISMSLSGTPAGGGQGSPLTWDPNLTTIVAHSSGVGTLAGIWIADMDLIGNGGASSASGWWSDNTSAYAPAVRRRLLTFTFGNENGYVNGNHTNAGPASRVNDIQPVNASGFFDVEATDHSNNIPVWTGLWMPVNFTERTVNWSLTLGSYGILSQVAARDQGYDNGFLYPLALNVATLFGSGMSVQVVPSPAGILVLGGVLVAACRRRRQ